MQQSTFRSLTQHPVFQVAFFLAALILSAGALWQWALGSALGSGDFRAYRRASAGG
jgi:hypothetical protein